MPPFRDRHARPRTLELKVVSDRVRRDVAGRPVDAAAVADRRSDNPSSCPRRKLKHERIDGEARLRSVPKSGDRLPALAVARASPCAMISAYELHCSIVDKKRAGTEDAARRKQRRGPDSPVGLNK